MLTRITFIVILLIFISSIFASEFMITSKIKENPTHLGLQLLDDEYKYDNNGELCALLIVRCGVDGINFYNSVSKVAQIKDEGKYLVTMKKGARYIELRKDGFGSYKENFGLVMKSGSVYEMSVDEKFKQVSQVPIMITCNQNGAEVFVDGVSKGKTSNKMLTTKLELGKHTIRIEKDGFASKELSGNITENNYTFDFQLVPAMPATVTITTRPSGATVYIDKMRFGVTPKSSFFDAGTYPIKIELENYETITEQITIVEPETSKSYNLTDIRATLTIKTHANATVTFNGRDYKGGIEKLVMPPQSINFSIIQDMCETIEETYSLKKGENKVFELYPEDIGATLTIKTHANATVTFNGKDFKGGVSNKKIAPQVLEIEVSMPKAETITRVITLKPKSSESVEVYPEIQTGTIQVMAIPTNANIELKGDGGEHYTATGRKTFTDVPVGTYELIVTAEEHKSHEESFKVKADETIRKQITLEEGSDIPDNMVFVQGGTFNNGTSNVIVSDFYIGRYEVTQSEWQAVMGTNPSNWEGDSLPVEQVSWYAGVEFCNKKSRAEGLTPCYSGSGDNTTLNLNATGYRLPTEAEWEFAARGGNKSNGYKYSGSN
ncbi:MAG: PEGA domain-containing protein, partial [Candidatus Zophobacter franzmannii]|nr:PEGA domain-containing protein [Candidatus Zophobacter franzmannii]